MLRALRSSKPHSARAAGRKFNVCSALIWPAFGIVLIGPEDPVGLLDTGAVVGLDAREIELHELGGRELARQDRRMDVLDARLDEMELGRRAGLAAAAAVDPDCSQPASNAAAMALGSDEPEPVQREWAGRS